MSFFVVSTHRTDMTHCYRLDEMTLISKAISNWNQLHPSRLQKIRWNSARPLTPAHDDCQNIAGPLIHFSISRYFNWLDFLGKLHEPWQSNNCDIVLSRRQRKILVHPKFHVRPKFQCVTVLIEWVEVDGAERDGELFVLIEISQTVSGCKHKRLADQSTSTANSGRFDIRDERKFTSSRIAAVVDPSLQ